MPPVRMEVLNPRVASNKIRLITSDVALVDCTWTYEGNGRILKKPLLLVLRKEDAAWKVSALHILADIY
jgi:hypothetical protein